MEPQRATSIDLLLIAGAYVIAHGLMLLNNGAYWDDWLIVHGTLESITEEYREYGLPFFGYYHHLLNRIGVPAYRVLVFLSYMVSALCAHAVLRRIAGIDRKTALIIALFFALFPSNSARISIMASRIAVCYALFFVGLWLLSLCLERRSAALRIASLACLFASFLTHSFLVFYVVVLACIAWHERAALASLPALARSALRYLDFLLLPAVFWVLKLMYYEPYGRYRGYNRVTPASALEGLPFIDNAFIGGFIEPLADSVRTLLTLGPGPLLAAAVLAALGARFLARLDAHPFAAGRHSAWLLAAGVFFFVAGVFPYLAVGKIPAPENWDSRHQLLTPLGAAFILAWLVQVASRVRAGNLLCAVLLLAFTAANVETWIDFQRDWYKQVSLIENFKVTPEIERGTQFLVEDRTTDLDAVHRTYRPYEYAGLLRAAFGDERRQGRVRSGEPATPPWIVVTVEHGPLTLTPAQLIELRLLESRDEQMFRNKVKQALRLSVDGGIPKAR